VGPARSAFRRLVAALVLPLGQLTGAAAMLAAVAAIVLALGGAGVLGPLGSVVSGAGDLRSTERAGTGTASAGGAIVAQPSLSAATTGAGSGGGGHGGPVGARGPGSGSHRGGGGSTPSGPSGSAPSTGGSPPGHGPSPAEPPSAGGGHVVQTVGDTVRQVGDQAPAPARPVTDQVNRVTEGLTGACRRLPACP
jgi:hypothetical protein